MKKTIVVITGILAFLPLFLSLIVLGYYLGFEEVLFVQGNLFNGLLVANLGTLIYFIYKLIRIETITIWSKFLWFFRFLITGFIAMPIFWYYFILKEDEYGKA